MQCLWLLHEEGDSLVRQRKFALALKRYHQIFAVRVLLLLLRLLTSGRSSTRSRTTNSTSTRTASGRARCEPTSSECPQHCRDSADA